VKWLKVKNSDVENQAHVEMWVWWHLF